MKTLYLIVWFACFLHVFTSLVVFDPPEVAGVYPMVVLNFVGSPQNPPPLYAKLYPPTLAEAYGETIVFPILTTAIDDINNILYNYLPQAIIVVEYPIPSIPGSLPFLMDEYRQTDKWTLPIASLDYTGFALFEYLINNNASANVLMIFGNVQRRCLCMD